jgi:hypothetical protein
MRRISAAALWVFAPYLTGSRRYDADMSVARSYASQLEKAIFQINTSSIEDLCQATRLCPL